MTLYGNLECGRAKSDGESTRGKAKFGKRHGSRKWKDESFSPRRRHRGKGRKRQQTPSPHTMCHTPHWAFAGRLDFYYFVFLKRRKCIRGHFLSLRGGGLRGRGLKGELKGELKGGLKRMLKIFLRTTGPVTNQVPIRVVLTGEAHFCAPAFSYVLRSKNGSLLCHTREAPIPSPKIISVSGAKNEPKN